MAQVWKCVNCGFVTWEPRQAGDHERKFYGQLIPAGLYDGEGNPLHYMDDIGE